MILKTSNNFNTKLIFKNIHRVVEVQDYFKSTLGKVSKTSPPPSLNFKHKVMMPPKDHKNVVDPH